ncbi:type IV toxin-antitoxin system AbiEi family antitoxin domain-containing protein [Janibacter alittae]|uniref:Type IV toxin-antitoxin system AbiEi family antitoxin domain-containing protein n=1 Tax=Janibacter alittae TaxID=3115209 RepID=A0ABZ2ML67_9MICO
MIDVPVDLFSGLLALPDGIFTRQDALRVGVTDDVLTAAVRRGVLIRPCRGAYTSPDTWAKGEARHLLARAALRLYPDAVLAGAPAVRAHGIPLFEVPLVRVDIMRPVTSEATTARLRIRPLRDEVVQTSWGPATDLPSSLVQLTMDHGIASGLASFDAALHTGAVTRDELEAAYARVAGWPRSSRVRCALAWSDGHAESLGESVTRAILLGAGWEVESQVLVADENGEIFARADLGIKGTRVLLEFDGKVKYSDGGVDALFREKRREDRIRAQGYVVVRVTWADLFHPERIVAAVQSALMAAVA